MANVISGQITVTTAGTAVAGPDSIEGLFEIAPMATNTGTYCYVGNDGDGDVSSANGYVLKINTIPLVISVSNLENLRFDSDTSGDKLSFIRIAGPNPQDYPATV